jgi:hypothetical protein
MVKSLVSRFIESNSNTARDLEAVYVESYDPDPRLDIVEFATEFQVSVIVCAKRGIGRIHSDVLGAVSGLID